MALVVTGIVVCGFVPYALFATRAPAELAQGRLDRSLSQLQIRLQRPRAHGTHEPESAARPAHGSAPQAVHWPAVVPVGTPLAVLSIPSAGVKGDVVVQGVDTLRLEEGPGHYQGTAMPGDPGNVAIAGHRTTWLRPFYDLQATRTGDLVSLRVGSLLYRYRVFSVRAVAPTDVGVLAPHRGWYLTLTTCTPRYSAAQRLVVQARLLTGPRSAVPAAPARSRPRAAPAARGAVRSAAVPRPEVVRLPPSTVVVPTAPPVALVGWGLGTALLVALALLLYRRDRLVVALLVPAVLCCVEAYGAAAQLVPGSW